MSNVQYTTTLGADPTFVASPSGMQNWDNVTLAVTDIYAVDEDNMADHEIATQLRPTVFESPPDLSHLQIRKYDVLMPNKTTWQRQHPGNRYFYYDLRERFHGSYAAASCRDKKRIVKEMVDAVATLGGRFLAFAIKDGRQFWMQVTSVAVRREGSKVLRSHRLKQDFTSDAIRVPDVLLGRGPHFTQHPGNERFLHMRHFFQPSYSRASKKEKSHVIKAMVDAVVTCGGRFMHWDDSTSTWREVSPDRAARKAGQTLRGRTK
jgi:hypothetical protein